MEQVQRIFRQLWTRGNPSTQDRRNMASSISGDASEKVVSYLAKRLSKSNALIEQAWSDSPRNVRSVLCRQILNTETPDPSRPICELIGFDKLAHNLQALSAAEALFTLARIYDEAHLYLCQHLRSGSEADQTNGIVHQPVPRIDLSKLAGGLSIDSTRAQGKITLKATDTSTAVLEAEWTVLPSMSFDDLQHLSSLRECLPGEKDDTARSYAGIGGGGGSDVISASLLGRMLHNHGKRMDLLISTRTWNTGSQGKKGSTMGVKREIQGHDGPAKHNGSLVPGTYRVTDATHSEGRDLEAVPLSHHKQIWMILDQSLASENVPLTERATLHEQFEATLAQGDEQTVIVVDTGGDVFGADNEVFSTVDQDLRVQKVMSGFRKDYNLITVVLAPGVDAPCDAPEKALRAGGKVYKPTLEERQEMERILVNEYHMDGSEPDKYPGRFGKTSLALQARLRGREGWVSLDLPEYVINTWKNPWSSFVYIRPCMSDIIFMPLLNLLPLIDPEAS